MGGAEVVSCFLNGEEAGGVSQRQVQACFQCHVNVGSRKPVLPVLEGGGGAAAAGALRSADGKREGERRGGGGRPVYRSVPALRRVCAGREQSGRLGFGPEKLGRRLWGYFTRSAHVGAPAMAPLRGLSDVPVTGRPAGCGG